MPACCGESRCAASDMTGALDALERRHALEEGDRAAGDGEIDRERGVRWRILMMHVIDHGRVEIHPQRAARDDAAFDMLEEPGADIGRHEGGPEPDHDLRRRRRKRSAEAHVRSVLPVDRARHGEAVVGPAESQPIDMEGLGVERETALEIDMVEENPVFAGPFGAVDAAPRIGQADQPIIALAHRRRDGTTHGKILSRRSAPAHRR